MASSPSQPDRALAEARRRFADELRFCANVRSAALLEAFASVPRERFLGPGPWHILDYALGGYWQTESDDPAQLYHNVLVAIDRSRGLNNGQPALWAFLLQQMGLAAGERLLHIGAGVGYYSAVMAEVVGARGRVTAVEVDEALAARARDNLADRANVTVLQGDGCALAPTVADAIVVNAGVTHPQPQWLDGLTPGGRLLLPLTVQWGGGYMLMRRLAAGFSARFLTRVGIFPAAGGRDPAAEERLKQAFQRRGYEQAVKAVRSLRREPHDADDSCWLHAPDFCLSTKPPPDGSGDT